MAYPLRHTFIPLINYFGARKIARKFSEPPILIGGCARSGTTLLQSILSAHPAVFVFPHESAAFGKWKRDNSGRLYPARIDKLHREALRYRIPGTASRWCSKAPSNVRKIGEILEYFHEEVRFIHLVRDARDVVLSRHPKNKKAFWVPPERWIRDVKAGLAYKDHPGVCTLRYEDLIQDFRHTIEDLCHFIGLPVTDEILNWHAHTPMKKSSALFEDISSLYQSSIGKWKNTKHQDYIRQVMQNPELVKLLQELNYE